MSLCVGTQVPTTARFDVNLERAGDVATVLVTGSGNPLILTLQVAATSVAGSISGSARDAAGVRVDVSGNVTGVAPSDTSIAASGNIDGQMNVPAGGFTTNGHGSSLAPR